MSKMRIKKHKGVKLLETRHPPPKKNSDDEDEEEKLLQCIMCNCMTIEEYLKRHIRYNHLISKEDIIDKLYNLHYPTQSASVSTQTSVTWIDDLDHRANSKDDPDKGKKIRPKYRPKQEVQSDDNDQYKPHHGDDDEEVLCPACGDVEDGTPMIACDLCDRWYHWACVGLNCKPPKGQEWMCTECSSKKPNRKLGSSSRFVGDSAGPSGVKQKFKRNLPEEENDIKVTAVVKPKRGKVDDSDTSPREKVAQRRLSGRGKSAPDHSRWENGSPDEQSRKRYSSSDRETPQHSKSSVKYSPTKKTNKHRKNETDSEEEDEDEQSPEDLNCSDDSMGDKDFEPHESDYDEQDMKLGGKVEEQRNSLQKSKKHKKKLSRDTDEFDDMTRDDMRDLCHKEMINASGSRDDLEQRLRRHFRKKKETQEIKRDSKKSSKKFKLTEVTEGDGVCKICGLGWNLSDDLELGPLYKYGICQAHLHCLMFSSGLIQGGDEKEGIVGFMPDDVLREWQRGAKLKCTFCKEIYATVGCCQRTCMKTYHLPCGIKYGALNEYYGNFDSYCPLHRSKRTPKNRAKNYVLTDLGLVPEHVDMEAGFDSEKYKAMLRKLESEISERRKSTERKEIPKSVMKEESEEPPYKKEKKEFKKRQEFKNEEPQFKVKNKIDRLEESSEDDSELTKKRPGPKSKTMIKKKKVVEEFKVVPHPESSEEDKPLSKIRKIKPTTILKKSNVVEEKTPKHKNIKVTIRGTKSAPPATNKREGKRVRKSTFGSDIYSSAQDELKKLLERKHLINIDETFVDLAGTRRCRSARTTSVVDDNEDDDDDYSNSRSQSRSGRKCIKRAVVEVDDEEDYGSKSYSSKIPYNKKSDHKRLPNEQNKGDETIESIASFLDNTTSRKKSLDKREKRNSGPDSTDELIESDDETQKEDSPENDSKSPPTPNLSENEFEDTEQDSGHENLDQNDGFTDCADLSNVTSDEGTDADVTKSSKAETSAIKVTFNDEENFEQMDLSGLIKNLENESMEQEEYRKSMERRENDQKLLEKEEEPNKALNAEENKVIDKGLVSRFKCPFCSHHSKNKKRIEQHVSYAHNRKNISKNLANKQEMMIFIDKTIDKDVSPVKSSQVGLTEIYVKTMSDNFPFFKYASDDMAEAVEDKEDLKVNENERKKLAKSSPEHSESKRVRKKTEKNVNFILWDDVRKKPDKSNTAVSQKEQVDDNVNQNNISVMDLNPAQRSGRKNKQNIGEETCDPNKNAERDKTRRRSPKKDDKSKSQNILESDQKTVPSLKEQSKKHVDESATAKSDASETPRTRRGRPRKEEELEDMVVQITPRIEEPLQSDNVTTPKKRRSGRPKKGDEEIEASKSDCTGNKGDTPGRALNDEMEENPPPQTPASSRRSGRSNKLERIEEEIKSALKYKRTRQNNKIDVMEGEDKNYIAEENMGETEEFSKLPEATQSNADSSFNLSRRGRKYKTNVPLPHADLKKHIGQVVAPSSELEPSLKSAEDTDGDNANKEIEEKISSPFKLLFSTVGDYHKDDFESNEELSKVVEDPLTLHDECTLEQSVSNPLEESVEPDSTTSMEDPFDQLIRRTQRSSRSSKNLSVCPGAELIIKYTDDTGEEVQWVQGADSSDMPHLYRGGSLAGKVDLAEVEHALDQDVQIPDKFREMLPVTEDKEEEENNKRIVLRIKKVKS